MSYHRYTPVEIIDAGINDTRETFADLYLLLDYLRAAAAWQWHRAHVDEDVELLDGEERLPQHPAPAGFGGAELAIPRQPLELARLTDAGFTLYTFGVRIALDERARLEADIAAAQGELEALRLVPSTQERRRRITAELHARAAYENRRQTEAELTSRPQSTVSAWDDIPVRIPGTMELAVPAVANVVDAAATPNQLRYLSRLVARQPGPYRAANGAIDLTALRALSRAAASKLIQTLTAA